MAAWSSVIRTICVENIIISTPATITQGYNSENGVRRFTTYNYFVLAQNLLYEVFSTTTAIVNRNILLKQSMEKSIVSIIFRKKVEFYMVSHMVK